MNYDFRQKMVLHREGCCLSRRPATDAELPITDAFEIVLPRTDSRLLRYAARDLAVFFADCAGVYLRVRYAENLRGELNRPAGKILLLCAEDFPEFAPKSTQKAAFTIRTDGDSVTICGNTDRGVAQGVYYLEDQCKLDGTNLLRQENRELAPLFSPRMTHSGYGLDNFPDVFLEAAAHAGMDAILVYAGHPDSHLGGFEDKDCLWPGSKRGLCDFRELCHRAAGFGLDVYVYSHLKCDVYPTDPGAEDYYEASFGRLMRSAPEIAGFVLVGETFEFPSRDPHTSGVRYQLPQPADAVKPDGSRKPSPGWYPCEDYPLLLERVGSIVHRVNPNTELVFWSYNWGYVDREARLELIRHLPKGTTLLVTFEMWEYFHDEQGRTWHIDDYSVAFEGPSQVYLDEAEEAKRLGIRLYTMANTGGRTWDCGIAPYLPAPQQWLKRYRALVESREAHGLSGIMEDHHYGWMPSFLSLFSKNVYWGGSLFPSSEAMLAHQARYYYGERSTLALEAWEHFSEGMVKVTACNKDQCGPLRCGPGYPLLFDQDPARIHYPAADYAWHGGGGIWFIPYGDDVVTDPDFLLLRYERISAALAHFEQGNALLRQAIEPLTGAALTDAKEQLAVSGILECTFRTTKHVMAWTIARRLLLDFDSLPDCTEKLLPVLAIARADLSREALAGFMEYIARQETENVAFGLECWRENSLVGFEASMEYAFDDECAAYKNRLTQISLKHLHKYLRSCRKNARSEEEA